MKRKTLSLVLVFALIISIMIPAFATEIKADESRTEDKEKYSSKEIQTVVDIDCYPEVVAKGEEFTLCVQVEDVTDLYAVGISLKYDTSILQLVEYNDKPFNDEDSIFNNNGYTEYLNRYDTEDSSIIHYATGLTGEVPGYNLDWNEIAKVTFKVKTDASIDGYLEFDVTNSLINLSLNETCVQLSDSEGVQINYDKQVDWLCIYDNNDVNGDITLDWTYQGDLQLNAHLLVPDEQNGYFDVGWENTGDLNEFPHAFLLEDDNTWYEDENNFNYNAQEQILYNQLIPGSKFIVHNYEDEGIDTTNFDIIRSSEGTSISVQVDDSTYFFNINEATVVEAGDYWHVFEVVENEDGSIGIETINEIDNVFPYSGPDLSYSIEWNEDEPYIEGTVYNAVEGYNIINLNIGFNLEPIEATLDTNGRFVFQDFSDQLCQGINNIEIEYPVYDGSISVNDEIWYHIDYICTLPQYDEVNQKYSGDIELSVFDDYEYINADFDTMNQIYANIYEIDSVQLMTQNPLALNLNEGKYSVITNGIQFSIGHGYYVKFYSDPGTIDNIGAAYFDIDPDIVVTSDCWCDNVETSSVNISGYIAFADDYLLNYDSFKVFVNEDPDNGTGIEITDIDSNGNFSVGIELIPGNNSIKLEFAYNDGSWSRICGEVYYITPEIGQPTIVSLVNQSDESWNDGTLTQEELEAITGEYPSIAIDVELPDGVGTGYFGTNDSREGYWLSIQIENNNEDIIYSTMSPIQEDEINSKIKDKSISTYDLLHNLVNGETYNIYSKILLFEADVVVDESYLSDSVAFYYSETTPQLSTDATLSDLTIDGITVDGFSSEITSYSVELPAGTTEIPTLGATTNDPNANAVVTQAAVLPGTATVEVTAEDGVTIKTYTVEFSVAKEIAYISGTIESYNNIDLGITSETVVKFVVDGNIINERVLVNGESITFENIGIQPIPANTEIQIRTPGFVGKHTTTQDQDLDDDQDSVIGITIELRAGDIDGDGDININDVNAISTEYNIDNAVKPYDLDGDGKVNARDIYFIGKNFGY